MARAFRLSSSFRRCGATGLWRSVWFLAYCLLALATLAAASPQRCYRILPLGDSITEGGRSFTCYRYRLWEKLFTAGYLVEYVGSRKSESRIGPLAHEGYGGKDAEFLAGTVSKHARDYAADIVLLHAGHNHTVEEQPVPGIVGATESIVASLRAANPQVIILLAQVIPSGKLPKYSYIPELNRELAKQAERLNSAKQRLILVNQADGFDWTSDAVEDKVHPNARGAEKMAQRWFDALARVMDPPRQSFHPRLVTYKQVDGGELKLHVFTPSSLINGSHRAAEVSTHSGVAQAAPPAGFGSVSAPVSAPLSSPSEAAPAIVFFFGGGWTLGTPLHFYPECAHFAAKGMVAISADYRIESVQRTTPFESVADGKSAIRWVRQHAAELGVDPNRIVAAGASAGGQVAAAAGTLPGLDEASEDTQVSSRPNALVLWYPVIDNGPGGYGYDRVRERFREISPLHNIGTGTPPTLILLGTKDAAVPVKTAAEFKSKVEQAGGRCDVKLFEGGEHPLYAYRKGGSPLRQEVLAAADEFLGSLGVLEAPERK